MDFESYFYSQDDQNFIQDELMGFYGKERQGARLKQIKAERELAEEQIKIESASQEYYF